MNEADFRDMLEQILEVESGSVSMDASLDELDFDSLTTLSFISEVDTRLGVAIDASRIADATTPADLLAAIDEAVDA
jgi:acyl carrier protein